MKNLLLLFVGLLGICSLNAQNFWEQNYSVKGLATVRWVDVADLDNDGLEDIIVGTTGDLSWWKNLGNGNLSQQPIINSNQSNRFILKDINSDGFMDIGTLGSVFYLNDGNGNFSFGLISGIGGHSVYTFADFDNDGDQDAVLRTNSDGALKLYSNDGNQNFALSQTIAENFPLGFINRLESADMNADGFPDLILATDESLSIIENNNGMLNTTTEIFGVACSIFNYGDLDNDGDLDLVYVSTQTNNVNTRIQNDDMTWSFGSVVGISSGANHIEMIDRDGDGDLDLIFPKTNLLSWVFNNQDGDFIEGQTFSSSISTPLLRSFDIDGDGDKDLLSVRPSTNGNLPKISKHINEGGEYGAKEGISYHFTVGQIPKFSASDIDNDGDNDLIINNFGEMLLSINDGNGNLTIPQSFANANTTNFVIVHDINKDGWSDFLAGTPNSEIAWFENNQMGSFEQGTIVGEYSLPSLRALEILDVNADGATDILSYSYSLDSEAGELNLFLNNGNNTYEKSIVSNEIGFNLRKFEVADYDNDGDLDFACIAFNNAQALIFDNEGEGTFTRLEMEFANPITTFHFADTNGNGFSEILVSESRSDGVVVRQREFDGVNWTAPFGESFGYFFNLTTQNTGLIEPEDVNGDGIIDIVFAIDFVKTGSQEYKSRAGYMLGEGEGQYDSPDYFYEYNTYAHDYRHIQSADMNGDGSPDPLLHFWAEGLNVNFAEDEYDNISYFVNDFTTIPSIDTADISTVCHSANTYDTAEDDYLLLKMMVKETFAGTKYIVDASNATIEPPLAVYDEKHNFRVYPTTSEDLEITVTDITNPSLSLTFTLENTLSCSDFSQLVSFEINNVSCSDNETPNNLDDDIINFELLIESSTFSGEYVLNAENLEEATGNYNVVSSFASITGAAGAGDLNISLTDASNEDLTLSLTIEDTGVCSVSSTETSDFLQNIQLRENPVSDYLRFSYRNFARSSDYKLVVRDLNGIMKHEQALSGDFLSISAITWNTGLYVYSIENKENGEFVSTGKFVKL